jgi:hypothetical protein
MDMVMIAEIKEEETIDDAQLFKYRLLAEQKHILDPQPTKSIPLWISVPVVVVVFYFFMKFTMLVVWFFFY